jgi:hypothetical protein
MPDEPTRGAADDRGGTGGPAPVVTGTVHGPQEAARREEEAAARAEAGRGGARVTVHDPDDGPYRVEGRVERDILGELQSALDRTAEGAAPAPSEEEGGAASLRRRIATEPDTVERDLIKLILTVVELVRQLMERQALRRVDQGDLSEDQEERIGMTLMLLEERMTELRERYGLSAADLNLDLGPLGSLLPASGD